MVYANNFVVAIRVNGQFCEETSGGLVTLPFGSEYVIRLRNKNNRRAVAKVFVDGENVSSDGIVVPAQSYVDLERSVDKAVKFKFVSAESGEAIDFGKNNKQDDSNGKITVEWTLEKEQKFYKPVINFRSPYWNESSYDGGISKGLDESLRSAESYTMGGATRGFSNESIPLNTNAMSEGCTVEGSYSSQTFNTVHVDLETWVAATIELRLRGYNQPVTPQTVSVGAKFCTRCGTKAKADAKFCSSCGTKL